MYIYIKHIYSLYIKSSSEIGIMVIVFGCLPISHCYFLGAKNWLPRRYPQEGVRCVLPIVHEPESFPSKALGALAKGQVGFVSAMVRVQPEHQRVSFIHSAIVSFVQKHVILGCSNLSSSIAICFGNGKNATRTSTSFFHTFSIELFFTGILKL